MEDVPLLTTSLRNEQSSELKGFFRFKRTEYSTLEFSCLQNQRGRFVELCEYHGGAQRGGIRVPKGYLGKGWHRFAEELNSFFLGKQPPVEFREDRSCNGKSILNRKLPDSRDPPAKISHPAGNVTSINSANLNLLPDMDTGAGETSRDQAMTVVDFQGALKLAPPEPLSPIAAQKLDIQDSPARLGMEVSGLQLSLLETMTSKEVASPISCTPLNILAPPVAPPLIQSGGMYFGA
uniref:Uncharacterized protein n=1 Tax=Fagus sylvatica TaxID=28930 RepID=A0A2N9F6L3_FAGSY